VEIGDARRTLYTTKDPTRIREEQRHRPLGEFLRQRRHIERPGGDENDRFGGIEGVVERVVR
jgi:hypothetical protein